MIKLTGIEKTYRAEDTETRALAGVSLSIGTGEFVAIMGPSGCGKSTLLNILGLVDRPGGGTYEFAGEEVSTLPERQLVQFRRRHIGFVFQSFNLIGDLSVEENIELPLLYRGMPKAERKSRVREVLELVGLDHRARHKPNQLSGGQQQRVAVARAVAGDPKLILADEPTGNLDSRNGEEVMEMLSILNEQGTTIVMVTHSPSHAARAGRTITVLDGLIVPEPEMAL